MQWLNEVVDKVTKRKPEGKILIESGASPSGTYHIGHLREVIICDALLLELKKRGRLARHIHFVDDLDALRKIPLNVPVGHEKYLGRPLCDIPAPDDSDQSYADYFFKDFISSAKTLGIEMEVVRSHKKYRQGFFVPAIEKGLENADKIRSILENVSGHRLGDDWSPIQVMEEGYLKKRRFLGIDINTKTITYEDLEGDTQTANYSNGDIKLDWRLDWPARWWLLAVDVEPAGRDHSTKGGSFDTGLAIDKDIFGIPGPLPLPYDFVNRAGEHKKMSASQGTGINAAEVMEVLQPELVRYFMLRYEPGKRLFFDSGRGVTSLSDEFSQLLQKQPRSPLLHFSKVGLKKPVISNIPFLLLAEAYQAALKDPSKTIENLKRSEYQGEAKTNLQIIKDELSYVSKWLEKWAPEDIKFELAKQVSSTDFSKADKNYLGKLADKIAGAPAGADGEWFHKAIYDFKDSHGMDPQQLFGPLYRVLIGRESGPRAGWFLSILPRNWLIKRLRLEQ